jgi:hypothetical protein
MNARCGKRAGLRPHLGVMFQCCAVYSRVYLNKAGTAFTGHCPKCAKPVTIRVGPGGSRCKQWIAG